MENSNIPDITSAQVRALRSYFDWTQREAADRFGINFLTLGRIEKKESPHKATMNSITLAALRLGVRFDEGGGMILPPEPPAT
jgi:transcriptional regulator with XRE-family HTH domain